MGKVNALTHLFSAGEVSRAALNRVDKEIIRLHAERQENIVPHSIGKAGMRPGFQFLDEALGNVQPRLVPFVKGVDDTALLELTNGALRVRVDDEIVSRDAVTATVTNGDFSSATGWTTSVTGAATATISGGMLTLAAPARGGKATCSQEVTVADADIGQEHALRINVTDGPVTLRVGGLAGGDEYIEETSLNTGEHSLAFTPTGVTGIDAFTVLLLHCNGSDASTTFTDSSAYGNTVTAVGNAQVDTAITKFGTGSAMLALNSYIHLDGNDNFAFGDGDFTIDFWFYLLGSKAYHSLYDARPTGSHDNPAPAIAVTNGNLEYFAAGLLITGSAPSTGVWHHAAVSRSGTTTRLFLNGVLQGSATDTIAYVMISNHPRIGRGDSDSNNFDLNGHIDELRVSKGIARWTSNFTPPTSAYGSTTTNSFHLQFISQLEREVIVDSAQIEGAGEISFTAPWGTEELREIRYDQSGDIVFLAHGNWRPRTIERRSNRSWSLTQFEPEDGPFTISRTANVRLKPSASRGNVTLTAEAAFFKPDHVGALMRLSHERLHKTWTLANEAVFTDGFRVRGIGTENQWAYVITGTWVGTITLERSFDGADFGFADTGTTHTINASGTVDPAAEYDNQIFWNRYTFQGGEYTSGSATIEITYGGEGGSGVCRITDYSSSTSVGAEVFSDFNDVEYTASWLEGDWSDRRGWPEAIGFFDGRLWFARRDRFWGSESDDFFAFNLDTEGDAGSIQRSIASGGFVSQTQWIMGLQRLILGTNAAPLSCRSSSFDEPLTPTNLTMKPASTEGAARVSPVIIGSRGVFVGSDRERLFELGYNVDAQDYVATDLTRIHEDFAEAENPDLYEDAFVELAYQNAPQPYLWALRDDGVAAAILFNPNEEARACFKITTGRNGLDDNRPVDRIVSVAILPQSGEDLVYVAVERTISDGASGTERNYYIEKAALHKETITRVYDVDTRAVTVKNGLKLADSFITATGLGGIGQVITGLDHLEGRDVIIIGENVDGGYGPTSTVYTVSSGQITTEEGVTGTVCIGLPYEGFYKSAKLAFAAQGGTALLQKKKVEQLGLALLDTHPDALLIGPDFDNMNDVLPRIDSHEGLVRGTITVFDRASEEEPFTFDGDWDTDSRVCLKIQAGYSATLSAMTTKVNTEEK
jgi:hypothetical protein